MTYYIAFTLTTVSTLLLFILAVPVFKKPKSSVSQLKKSWTIPKELSLHQNWKNSPERTEIHAIFHYPTDARLSTQRPGWMDKKTIGLVTKNGIHKKIPPWVLSHFRFAQLPVQIGSPVSTVSSTYPLIMFSPGLKGTPEVYSTIAIELASRGFIVCCINHTDGTSSLSYDHDLPLDDHVIRHGQLKMRAKNISWVLDRLLDPAIDPTIESIQKAIDTQQIFVMGHSFGAATAIKSVQDDNRIISCVCLDPWMFPLSEADINKCTDKPMLILASHSWQWEANRKKMEAKLLNMGKDSVLHYMNGVGHHNFSDVPYFADGFVLNKLNVVGDMDRGVVLDVLATHAASFLIRTSGKLEKTPTHDTWKWIENTVLHPSSNSSILYWDEEQS